MDFPVYQLDDAPAESKAALRQIKRKYGFIPNLLGLLAASPATLEAYVALARAFEKSDLGPLERQIVLLAASVENNCAYCIAAHSMAAKMAGAPEAVLGAMRSGAPLSDSRLEALRRFVRAVVHKRGELSAPDVDRFREEGFTARHVLEVLVGVAQKTLSNYANHVADTELDDAFREYAWTNETEENSANGSCCAA